MKKIIFENKFFVINRKHLLNIPETYINRVQVALRIMDRYSPSNKYFICNQDEPYAQDVIQTILKGEEAKKYVQKKANTDYTSTP